MGCRQTALDLLGDWLRRHNQQVWEGIEAEAEVREGMSGGGRGGREEPNAGTVVVKWEEMRVHLGATLNDYGDFKGGINSRTNR